MATQFHFKGTLDQWTDIPNKLIWDEELSSNARMLHICMLSILDHQNKYAYLPPSVPQKISSVLDLASILNMSKKALLKAENELIAAGWIRLQRNKNGEIDSYILSEQMKHPYPDIDESIDRVQESHKYSS